MICTKHRILYIHGYGGNPEGGTYKGIKKALPENEYELFSIPFPNLHTDVVKTLKQIEKFIRKEKIDIVIGASLGGFYALRSSAAYRIVINPCMRPSMEIPLLQDWKSGKPADVPFVVKLCWKIMEKNLNNRKENVFGIFGDEDKLFHYDENCNYEPLFRQLFSTGNECSVFVKGGHSLEDEAIAEGLGKAFDAFGFNDKKESVS